jgi:hypothetical protein
VVARNERRLSSLSVSCDTVTLSTFSTAGIVSCRELCPYFCLAVTSL